MQSVRADSGKVLDRALLRGGEKIRGNAVLLCPVDTGELRNSIRVQRLAPGVVTVGTNKEYAIFVEYGTGTQGDPGVPHTAKLLWRWQDEQGNWHTSHGHRAQSFLRAAVGKNEEKKIYAIVAEELRKAIGKLNYPDNTFYAWEGKPTVYVNGGNVGEAMKYTLSVTLESTLEWNGGNT